MFAFGFQRGSAAVGSLSLALLMTGLDASLTNTSLAALAQAFGSSLADARWIVLAYLLAVTSLSVVAGRLGDVVGRRRVFVAAVAVFTLSSAVAAVASSLWWLVAVRAVMGACAAAMLALPLALGGDIPGVRPERVVGRLAAMSAIGTTLGPAVGSVVWHFTPGAIFLVNVPLGCVVLALALRHLPPDPRHGHQPVWFGGAGAWRPLFRDPAVPVSLATSALVATVVTATLIVGPFYLSRGLGLGYTHTGLVLAMGPAAAALTASMAGRFVERLGAARAAGAGLSAMAIGAGLLARVPAASGIPGYVIPLVVMTSGYAVFQTANNTAALAAAGDHRGVVGGLLTLSRNVGQIAGASAMTAVFVYAVGSGGLVSATADAIVRGLHGTLAVATVLIAAALALLLLARTRLSSAPTTQPSFVHPEGKSPC